MNSQKTLAEAVEAIAPHVSGRDLVVQLDPESEASVFYRQKIIPVEQAVDILTDQRIAQLFKGKTSSKALRPQGHSHPINVVPPGLLPPYDHENQKMGLFHALVEVTQKYRQGLLPKSAVDEALERFRKIAILQNIATTLRDYHPPLPQYSQTLHTVGSNPNEGSDPPMVRNIQILKVLPGEFGDPIRCELSNVSVDDSPAYEALSYTWGSPDLTHIIKLDGTERQITENLYISLQYLRRSRQVRTLWIDAICIDQDNAIEKAHQVRLMGLIYRQATRVLVWLGPKGHGGDYAMEVLNKMTSAKISTTNEILKAREFGEDMLHLLRREWWSRIWVLQEVCMAKDDPLVGCGDIWVPWNHIATAFKTVYYHLPDRPQYSEADEMTIKYRNECFPLRLEAARLPAGMARDLTDLALDASLATKATKPQDMIFALRGLLSPLARSTIIPNYSVPKEFIFTAATIVMLCEKGLSIYTRCAIAQNPSLPSWVPDFTSQSLSSPYFPSQYFDVPQETFDVNASSFRLLGLSQLGIDGIVFDKVEASYEFGVVQLHPRSPEIVYTSFYERLREISGIIHEVAHREVNEANLVYPIRSLRSHGTLYDLICAGKDPDGDGGVKFDSFLRSSAASDANVDNSRALSDYSPPLSAISGRKFFVTTSGFVGVGVPSIEVGDLVAILSGLAIPFILRDHGGYQSFVGVGWVNGLMAENITTFYEQDILKRRSFVIH